MAPIIKQGTFALNGSPMQLVFGFKPTAIFAYTRSTDGTARPVITWTPSSWCGRSQRMSSEDSLPEGIKGVARRKKLTLGNDPLVNVAGGEMHYAAFADQKSGLIGSTGWMGAPIATTMIVGKPGTPPVFGVVKRDNNEAPVARFGAMDAGVSVKLYGTGPIADGILSFNTDGTVSLGKDPAVNQLSGGAIGEGHDCITFYQQPGLVEAFPFKGNGQAGRVIAHTVDDPLFAIIVSLANNTKAGFKFASMGTEMVHATATTPIPNAVTTLTGGITIGTDTRYNNNNEQYYALVIGRSDVAEVQDRFVHTADPGEVRLRGTGSHIDCGTDNSLSFSGPFTLEWAGKVDWVSPTNGGAEPFYLASRALGDEGRGDSDGTANGAGTIRAGTWSWGIFGKAWDDLGTWDGPQFGVVTTDYNNSEDNASSENNIRTKPWRTGVLIPLNQRFIVNVAHDGFGNWEFWLNGVLEKQRKIDMRDVTLADDVGQRKNAGAGLNHRTMLGARQGSTAIGGRTDCEVQFFRAYDRKLTRDEIMRRYQNGFLGDKSVADVDQFEELSASRVVGNTMMALKNPANNGTITVGNKVLLGQF